MHPSTKPRNIIRLFLLYLCVQPGLTALAASPTPAQWRQLTSDKAFTYVNDTESAIPPVQTDSGFFQKLIYSIFEFFGSGPGKALLWCVVIAAAIFIVYKLLFSKDSILFGRSSKSMKEKEAVVPDEEDIATTNWEALMRDAMNNNDTRLAIRYSYMRLLQLLQKKGLISAGGEKTNYEYYTELSNPAFKQPFRQLSRRYEYVWYGQYPVSGPDYDSYISLFNDLKKQLGA